MKMEKKIFVAIHRVPHITKSGHACLRHFRFMVAAGPAPLGPRGGRGGRIKDGEFVSERRFGKWEDAAAFAARYAAEHGAETLHGA